VKILIVGGGGREHAMAWKAGQSPLVDKVYVAPGNAGTELAANLENVAIAADDIDGLLRFASAQRIDLTLVGPEAPLVAGIVDEFQAAGLRCFGPTRVAAVLEGSKAFMKGFLQRHEIPTAPYQTFTDLDLAEAYIGRQTPPIVVKASGLAAGKGVVIAHTVAEALEAATAMLECSSLGAAGREIVVEGFLQGEEASFIVVTDGDHVVPLATSQDHKALGEGDLGPNTGGMGAYSPAAVIDELLQERILREIILPTVSGMAEEGRRYQGFLYAGLMIDGAGQPQVLEYNCRLGDPETQAILMRLRSDLVEVCLATLTGKLAEQQPQWDPKPALCVVMSAAGYPNAYRKADVISGLASREDSDGLMVFHAGTTRDREQVVTSGGRVMSVCALGESVGEAQHRAYERLRSIHWEGAYYREDIGYRAIARETNERS
jgi:phosphoribosylamine---glycine ligase